MVLKVFTLYFLFSSANISSDTVFKYVSTKDTIYVFGSDIQKSTLYNRFQNFFLTKEKLNVLKSIEDRSGTLFFRAPNGEEYIPLQPIDVWKSYIPDGWYVWTYDGSFFREDGFIGVGWSDISPVKKIKHQKKCHKTKSTKLGVSSSVTPSRR